MSIKKESNTEVKYLSHLCGLRVVKSVKSNKGNRQPMYEFFGSHGHTFKTVFTYAKARLYAEGIAKGRLLNENERQKCFH